MNRLALIVLAPIALASSAFAQPMDPNMPGMTMPKPAAKTAARPVAKARPEKALVFPLRSPLSVRRRARPSRARARATCGTTSGSRTTSNAPVRRRRE